MRLQKDVEGRISMAGGEKVLILTEVVRKPANEKI